MLMAPAVLFLPKRMLCGPRNISTRSTSKNGALACCARPKCTPSTNCAADCSNPWFTPELIPRMAMVVPKPVGNVEARNVIPHGFQTGDARVINLVTPYGDHGYGHVHQALLTLLSGDQDFCKDG